MSIVALVTWILTITGGLFLLAIWLIEYDHDFQHEAATRLPVPVICAHALLAITGLVVWVSYLLLDSTRLAWAAVIIVTTGAALGLIMAFRWISVYRTFSATRPRFTRRRAMPAGAPAADAATSTAGTAQAAGAMGADSSGASAGAGIWATGQARGAGPAGATGAPPDRPRSLSPAPPERNFPLPVVIAHGAFALATVTLVVLTAIGAGGS